MKFFILSTFDKHDKTQLSVKILYMGFRATLNFRKFTYKLEIVFTGAAPAFDNLYMGCVFNINTVHKTIEKLTFQAF